MAETREETCCVYPQWLEKRMADFRRAYPRAERGDLHVELAAEYRRGYSAGFRAGMKEWAAADRKMRKDAL